jgi:signal transduction histidine kinase
MSNTHPKHILIVDDEPSILSILRNVFLDTPYRLSLVSTGIEAKTILEDGDCNVLLTDKNLPDISGMDLLRVAKNIDPTTEVIIITGYDSTETVIEAIDHNVYAYLLKSEAMDNIYAVRNKVEKALEKQSIIRKNIELLEQLKDQNYELENALDESKTLQAELVQSQKLAGIGTVAAGIAHEISSPLQGILSLSEAITEEPNADVSQSYASEIVEYCNNIRSIISGLSSYTRLPHSDPDSESTSISVCVNDAITLLFRSSYLDDIEINLDLDENCTVYAQKNELQQIFINLIKNGAEAIREKHGAQPSGIIKIHSKIDDKGQLITIEDNGTGIDSEHIGLLFDPFFTTKAVGQGTGLGLNIVYRLILKHKGIIHAESVKDIYTRFTIRFPAYP